MRVKLLCGEEAATVLLVDLARLSEYGRALDTLRPAGLRGRHRRAARPVDLLDNATHARHEISISGCTTGSYRAKRRAKRTCTPRPRISADRSPQGGPETAPRGFERHADDNASLSDVQQQDTRYASNDRPSGCPVPTPSRPTDRPPQLQGASRSTSHPRPERTAASNRAPTKRRRADDRRPRIESRACGEVPESARPPDHGPHRATSAINPQRCDASFTTRRRRLLATQLTPSLRSRTETDRRCRTHPAARPETARPRAARVPRGLRATRRTPATTPVRYPAGHPVTHHVKRQTVRTPGPDTEPSARPPQLQGASRSTSHPRPERTAASNRPPNRRRRADDRRTRIESPRPKPRLLRSPNQLGRPTTDRIEATRATNPAPGADGDQPVRVE